MGLWHRAWGPQSTVHTVGGCACLMPGLMSLLNHPSVCPPPPSSLHPKRAQGGNYLEGTEPRTRWNWKQTIGPRAARAGHYNTAWGYWVTDAVGLFELLMLCELVSAAPQLSVYTGYVSASPVARHQARQRRWSVRERCARVTRLPKPHKYRRRH